MKNKITPWQAIKAVIVTIIIVALIPVAWTLDLIHNITEIIMEFVFNITEKLNKWVFK